MSEELLIHCSAQETRVAVMVNGILEDLQVAAILLKLSIMVIWQWISSS